MWFYLLIFSILFLYFFLPFKETFSGDRKKELFEDLMDNYETIFPDRNRNGGGVQFFEYIYNTIKPNKEDFDLYNSFYCAVSGSPIDPERENVSNLIKIKDLQNNDICGTYFRCCWPCNCDIMKYSKVEKMNLSLKDGNYNYYVITIEDPCRNENSIPDEVTSFNCNNNKTVNGVHAPSGRLIIGILHDAKICNTNEKDLIKNNNLTGERCNQRNSMPVEQLNYGMGDIFIKLATIRS